MRSSHDNLSERDEVCSRFDRGAVVVAHAPSPAVQQSMIGGMTPLATEKVEAGEGEKLGDLLPDLVELFLTPYVGHDEALRLARDGSS